MHICASGTSVRRARIRARRSVTAAVAALALTATIAPAVAVPTEPDKPNTQSAWGEDSKAKPPKVKIGSNDAPKSVPSSKPTKEERAWAKTEQQRLEGSAHNEVSAMLFVPYGQGDVPWHRISNVRLTDSLVARVNYSNGNLMLAATDFDIAGVGPKLRLTRTYNSFSAPYAQVSDKWWLNYERNLHIFEDSVVFYDRSGAAVTFTQSSDGTFTYTAAEGYSLDLTRNGGDGSWSVWDRKSGERFHFHSNGTLWRVTDRNHGEITVDHHEGGGFKLTAERTGRWIDLVKVSATRWEATDNAGRTAVYTLDAAGNLIATTDTAGKTTAYTYDSSGRVVRVTSPEGRQTVFTYDAANRVTSMKRISTGAEGPTWTYSYSAADADDAGTTTVADPEQDETVYEHNGEGEVTKVTDPLGNARSSTYDAHHNAVTAVDAMGTATEPGNTTTYGWDSRNNLTSVELPTGATTSLTGYQTIAHTDLPGTISSPDGQETNFDYDTKGNTLSVATTGGEGGTRTFTYNDSDTDCGGFKGQRCTVKDANGKVTSFTYDDQGNLTKAEPPAPMGATTYRYDELGRPVEVTDGRGTTVLYTYDERDRVTKADTASYNTVTYTYDGDGNRTTRTDSTGLTSYIYDALGRETIRTLQDGSQTVMTHTADGSVATYDDRVSSVDYDYDDAGRLIELRSPTATTYEYNANGQRTQTSYPGNVQQKVTLDDSGRPTRITAVSGNYTLVDLSYDYSYTVGGQTVDGTKIRGRTDVLTDKTISYDYDSQGRLTYAEESSSGDSWLYCFDPAGNLTSKSSSASACPGGTDYTYNDASQLTAMNGDTSGWAYDKAGNELSGASSTAQARTGEQYTDYNQLSKLTVGGTSYTAEYAGTTNAERTRLGATDFHHGPLGLAGTTTGGSDTSFIREPSGTLNSVEVDGLQYWYLTDALGSVIGLVDGGGYFTHDYDYTPTGLPRHEPKEQKPQPYRFAGTYKDPTGLYKMGARYYDPHLGRFTQPDPSGQEINPYLYAGGDPVNRVDPSGLGWFDTAEQVWGVVSGCVTGVAVAAETGTITYAAVVGGAVGAGVGSAVGAGAAIVGSCAVGGAVGYYGGSLPTYG